jgi:hypothetical protein
MFQVDRWDDFGYESTMYAASIFDSRFGPRIEHVKAGWPFLCFDGATCRGGESGGSAALSGMLHLGGWYPVMPRWRELLLNVGFFAVAIWAIQIISIRSVRLAKRWLFYGPGLCKSCGYDLRGTRHGRCPECGTLVDLRATIHS